MTPYLNMMIPQFFFEYVLLAFILIVVLEGLIYNLGLQKNLLHRSGLLSSLLANILSTLAGYLTARLLASFDPVVLFLTSFLFTLLIEYLVVYSIHRKRTTGYKTLLLAFIANAITYILILVFWSLLMG